VVPWNTNQVDNVVVVVAAHVAHAAAVVVAVGVHAVLVLDVVKMLFGVEAYRGFDLQWVENVVAY